MDSWKNNLALLSKQEEIIQESQVLSELPFEYYNSWDNFMRGKTCPLLENGDHGIYKWDLDQFLTNYE